MVERPDEVGRGEGGVHQQRHAVAVGNVRDHGDVHHVESRVAQGLAEQQPRVWTQCCAPGCAVAGIDEGGLDAEAAQGEMQQVVRAAVECTRGDDVRAGAGDGRDRQVQRRLPAGGRDAAHAALERRDALLKHRHRRIAQPGIDVAGLLHVEERGRLVGIREHEGGAEVDRRCPRPGGGVGRGTGMHRQRVHAVVVFLAHDALLRWRCGSDAI